MNLDLLSKQTGNLGRLAEIVKVLSKYGLAEWLRGVEAPQIRSLFTSSDGQPLTGCSRETRIRLALTELGTTFIKVGQILSTRSDVVGLKLAEELAELQTNTPPDSLEEVRLTIEEELGKPFEVLFAEFDHTALASASIGQVHRARLHDGTLVVVKVQHRDIQTRIERDLNILEVFAQLAEHYSSELRGYRPREIVREFRRTLLHELDFCRESRSLQEFSRNFRTDDTVHFPPVFEDFTSRRVLTMGYVDGISVGKIDLLSVDHNLQNIARRGAHVFLSMVFRDGFYHADPHPGNIMVMDDDVIGILDCGMVARLDGQTREQFTNALMAAINSDTEKLVGVITQLATLPDDLDHESFRADIHDFLADYANQPLANLDLSSALNSVVEIIRHYHMMLPSKLSMFLRFLVVLEGTARGLDPNFSLAEMIRPYYFQILREQYSPKKLIRKLRRMYSDWDRLLTALPGDLAISLDRIKRGRFEVRMEHQRLQATVKLLVEGILTASLVVASSMMLSFRAPPVVWDISILGALGMIPSVILGTRVLRGAHRKRNEL